MNPELRQTLHTISRNLESANEAAQENIYTFTQLYIDPCLTGFKACLNDCTAPCFPNRDEHSRRRRARSRGPAELNFDFYDDWDADEDGGDVWGNDELDTLLAGNTRQNHRNGQPRKQRAMSYGSRNRRKSTALPNDVEHDPTIIPGSSYLGFLERLPWKIGNRVLRYKPSAADLQVNPGGVRIRDVGTEPLLEGSDDGEWGDNPVRQGRLRSGTTASTSTSNSLSSRGDLIPSDEEDDAVPLDDEFAMVLERRMTHLGSEDHNSGKSGKTSFTKRPRLSRTSTRTVSSKSSRSFGRSRKSSSKKARSVDGSTTEQIEAPSLADLQKEEEQARVDEETEVERKREAAEKLALTRGLSSTNVRSSTAEATTETKSEVPTDEDPAPIKNATEPVRTKKVEGKDSEGSEDASHDSDSKAS